MHVKKALRVLAAASFILFSILQTGFAKNPAKHTADKKFLLYVGTYTSDENHKDTGSKGIYAFRVDESGDKLQIEPLGLEAETLNPSFLAVDPSRKFLYAVNELSQYKGASSGSVTAFAIDRKTAKLSYLNEVASRGADPCYISFDKTGKYALVANYTGGSVATFPVLNDGQVGEAAAFVQHTGKSIRPDRQEGPHAHWIETAADNRYALAADLGLDEILVYRFNAADGSLLANLPAFAKLAGGTGPRHVAFHPNGKFVYVVDELNSTVNAFTYDAQRGVLKPLQTISTLPKEFSGSNDTAEIHVHPNCKFVYASNRGHDSIVVYAIDPEGGFLTTVQDISTQGKTPRNFEFDPSGRWLLAANEDSGTIVIFSVDEKTGKLTPTGQSVSVPAPVSLRFVAAE